MRVFMFISITLVGSMVMGCSDGNENVMLIGNWELRHISNPWTGESNYDAGNGTGYRFSAATYERYENGNLAAQGKYTTVRQKSGMTNEMITRIVFDSQFDAPVYVIVVKNNTLHFSVDAYDAPTVEYARVITFPK